MCSAPPGRAGRPAARATGPPSQSWTSRRVRRRTTVGALESEVGNARGYLDRAMGAPAIDSTLPGIGAGELALPATTGRS